MRLSSRTARGWKIFYAGEREELGPAKLEAMLADAEPFARSSPIVFPHTRMAVSGRMTAAAALSAVRSGADEVLAIGVLHGAREDDAELVAKARAGDQGARGVLRRVHDASSPFVAEEFSLDNFAAMVELAATREGKKAPRVVKMFPFFTDGDPSSLEGFEACARAVERGAFLVATADMIHHGVGYETPAPTARDDRSASTIAFARDRIDAMTSALARGAYREHDDIACDVRSDFVNAGPVFAELAGVKRRAPALVDLALVDYSETFACDPPTWVAAALVAW